MKKLSLYALLGVVGLMMTSCNEDFTDWAEPQSNPQEEAVTIPGVGASAVDPQNLNTEADSVPTFRLSTAALPEGFTLGHARVELTPADVEGATTTTVYASISGMTPVGELQKLIGSTYGLRPVNRTFNAHVYVDAVKDGQAMFIDAGTIQVLLTPKAPKIENVYYLTGSPNKWSNADKSFPVVNSGADPYSDPVFSITLTAAQVGEGIEFKLTPESKVGTDNWQECITADNKAPESKLANDNAGGNLKVAQVEGTKYYKLVFNLLELTWKVETMNDPELFLTGDHYGWGDTADAWKPLVPVWGTPDHFWTVIYLHAGEQFKFAPQAGWGNEFGTDATINDVAGAGVTDVDGNIRVSNAGWYILHVVNGMQRIVNILKPNVYLMGDTAGDWEVTDAHLFAVPATEDGEFVSPPFVKDADVRMCISLADTDWWKTEFIVNAGGKIDYRGKGDDQTRILVKAGQKAYLNFAAGTGAYR
ncbi:MAG: DUF5115 domain-containing protein [Prevotella sp.]|nr:DUF5115 domain-containing protein [Prevotella sp.]